MKNDPIPKSILVPHSLKDLIGFKLLNYTMKDNFFKKKDRNWDKIREDRGVPKFS